MIEVIYEDEFCLCVNKPSGLLTHPYKKETNEKENLLFSLRDQINQYLYPIHRLDRPTSGIVIMAKTPDFVREIQKYWHTPQTIKTYRALVLEKELAKGSYNFALKSESGVFQNAITHFSPLENLGDCTYIEATIDTGRRHQIRRHFSRRMQHLAGDRKYGKKKYNDYFLDHYGLDRLFLHATGFEFHHPIKEKTIKINCEIPKNLDKVLEKIKDKNYIKI